MTVVAGAEGTRNEIFFVDGRVPDIQSILDAIDPGAEIVVLDPLGDGIDQIAEALAGRTGIDAVHIVGHGDDGVLFVGDGSLHAGNVGDHAEALASIGNALARGGDILIYGCEVGAGEQGEALVRALAQATRADVAASDDFTGAGGLGGDWDLEVRHGSIETTPLSAPAYAELLAVSYTEGDIFPNLTPGGNGSVNTTFQFLAGDFDHDGDDDLVYWNGAGESYYRNDGGTLTHFATLDGTPFAGLDEAPAYGAINTLVEDFDGDGDKDIFYFGGGVHKYLTFDGSAYVSATVPFTGLPSGAENDFLAGDFDSDGDVDFVAWDGSQDVYYRNDGAGSFTSTTDISETPFAGGPVPNYGLGTTLVADFDGDGDDDIQFYAGDLGRAVYLRNDGGDYTDTTSPLPALPTSGSGLNTAIVGDFDSDGDVDLLFWTGSADAYYRNDGGGNFVLETDISNTPFAGLPVPPAFGQNNTEIADFDGDGDVDILLYRQEDHFTYTQNGAPPRLVASTPGDDATDVDPDAVVTLTFSEAVFAGSGTITLRRSDDDSVVDSFAATDPRVTGSGTASIGIDFATTLDSDTGYYLQFATKAFVDADGMTFGELDGVQRVGITDAGFLNFTTAADTNTAPSDLFLSDGDVFQSGGVDAVVGTLSTTDADAGDSHTYTLVSGAGDDDNGLFGISGDELQANDAGALAPGDYTVRVRTTDGGDGFHEEAFTITVSDDVAPAAPSAPDLAAASDSGASGSDDQTGDATPTFTGTAEASSTVRLYANSALVGSTTADGSGNWTITATTLSDGDYGIEATATDAAGNTSPLSSDLQVRIDTTGPSVSSVTVPANGTYDVGETLTFTVDFDETVIVSTLGGTPRIALTIGGSTVHADYQSGTGTALTFSYVVESGDLDNDGIAVGAAIDLDGGTIVDGVGNPAALTLNSVGSTAAVLVDAVDDVPVAADDLFTVAETVGLSGADLFADNGSGADADADGPALSVSHVNGEALSDGAPITLDSGATLTVRADGTFDYDASTAFRHLPDVSASGASNTTESDSFTYTLAGGGTATVTLTVEGGDSDGDVLRGLSGIADTLAGGIGSDTYVVDDAGDVVIELSGGGSADHVAAAVGYTLAEGVEVERLSTVDETALDAIDLTGNMLGQEITGNAGANVLDGGGSGMADLLRGLGGDDTYRVFNSTTTIEEAAGQGFDTVVTGYDYVLGAGVEVEVLQTNGGTGTRALSLTGNALAQEIIGNYGDNVLHDGGKGAGDHLRGLSGNDTYRVFNADTTIAESAAQGDRDTVISGYDYVLGAGVHVEVLQTNGGMSTRNLALTGNELAQEITGNNGDNRLEGQGGNDTLRGLGGRDSFVFADALGPDNVDTILDFDPLDDRFLMSNDIFSGFGDRTGEILPGHLRVNTTGEAQDASDMIIYDSDDGFLYYDADGFGAGDRVHFATIDADLAITNSDFVLA